jgi:Bacterial Ig-like domain (group 3)
MARTVNLVISGAVVMVTAIAGSGFLRRVVSAAAVLVACCGVLAGGAAAAAAAGPAPGAVTAWGVAQRIPGVNTIINVPADANATVVNSVSCAAPGDCAAGGFAHGGGDSEGYNQVAWVASETSGVWQAPVAFSLPSGDSGVSYDAITSVSCASPGNCVAVGYDTEAVEGTGYVDTYGALLINEVDGVWGAPEQVPGTDALNQGNYARASSVSCAAPGDCAVTGYVNGSSEFVDDENDGTWGTAQLVAGFNALADSTPVISCAAVGDCVVAGSDTSFTNAPIASVATESNGVWGSAAPLPGFVAAGGLVNSLSCPAVGQCVAGGWALYGTNQLPFVASESGGTWSSQEVPGYAGLKPSPVVGAAGVSAISCAAPGECAAAGSYQASGSDVGAFAVSESGGAWQTAQEIPGLVPAQSSKHFSLGVAGISCPAVGDCAAAINNGTTSAPYVVDETSGKWAAAYPVAGLSGPATVNAVSCAAPGACLAGGEDGEGSNADGLGNSISEDWVVQRSSAAATTTSVALSATTVTYGDEQAEKVTATVRATTPAPTGTVTVTAGSTTLCSIKLASGTGSCAIPVASLAPGKVTLTGRYGGGPGFAPSAGTAKPLTVAKAGTTTVLTLSTARAPYGHEQQVTLKFRVVPQHAGRPSGTVTMLWRGVTLCVIKLNHDVGACSLSSKRLGPGAYHIVAKYGGDRNFNGSSAEQTLTITG